MGGSAHVSLSQHLAPRAEVGEWPACAHPLSQTRDPSETVVRFARPVSDRPCSGASRTSSLAASASAVGSAFFVTLSGVAVITAPLPPSPQARRDQAGTPIDPQSPGLLRLSRQEGRPHKIPGRGAGRGVAFANGRAQRLISCRGRQGSGGTGRISRSPSGPAGAEADVIVHAHPGQVRDLLPPQAGDPAAPGVGGQSGRLRGQPRAPRGACRRSG